MTIRQATAADSGALAKMAAQMWNDTVQALTALYDGLAARDDAACFLAETENGPIGFAQCQLRHDYVEGTETSPVGYLEGIFVDAPYRRQGIARALLTACEQWAKQKGCVEFASDCELENETSLAFHLKMGFEEANRIICFKKEL